MNSKCDPSFKPILCRLFRMEDLEAQSATVVGLRNDATIAYVNSAWWQFASDNGGQPAIERLWGLGQNYLAALAEPLRPFYEQLLLTAPTKEQSSSPLSHTYECSSAQLYRRFAMQVFVLPDNQGRVLVNSRTIEMPHDPLLRQPCAPQLRDYMAVDGLVRQCAHCRRVQHCGLQGRWDWVPEWVDHPTSFISHSLCPICHQYYYPDFRQTNRVCH